MSDYWKSLPRKFCDTCKCWFADNKASIEFHEKGKKHKENVQKRISEIQRKGLKDFKKKQKLENEMEKIEKAALKAFQKDIERNPELEEQYKNNVTSVPKPTQDSVTQSNNICFESRPAPSKTYQYSPRASRGTKSSKVWYEGHSEEGHKYYWNSTTSESQWEPPEEGFISIEEQNKSNDDISTKKAKKKSHKRDSSPVTSSDILGPLPKAEPYGQWTAVENEAPEEIDLQLPEKSDNIVEVHIPLYKEDTFKIKEKTVGYLSGESGECTFKKRKNLSAAKRNVRQRLDET